jgi:glycerol-3-phosphate acyltransferase PlsY
MNNIIEILSAVIIGYLAGCIPSAYLVVKLVAGINIFKTGSGNAGAMNSFESTGKRWVGITVMLLDALKAIIAVLIVSSYATTTFPVFYTALFAVIGHNYNAFFKFKGGRGLATAAGALLLLFPLAVAFWLAGWAAVYYLLKRNIHVANAIATFAFAIIIFIIPNSLIESTQWFIFANRFEIEAVIVFIAFFIILRHIQPLLELRKKTGK